MIESVITARRRFLKPEGLVWPSGAKLYLVPCSAQQLYTETIECWGEKFGLDFSVLRYNFKVVPFIYLPHLVLQHCLDACRGPFYHTTMVRE